MDDLIRRQDAIDLWDKYHSCIATEAIAYDRELRSLPSAQPKPKQITPSDQEKSDKFGVKSGKTCADTISRQAAIDSILECCTSDCDNEYECGYDDGLRKGVHKLKHLPSVHPDPTLYGYPIEHLEMIARVMAKENCTPEDVTRMLKNVGEIALMVRDEMLERIKESVERTCKGVANEDCN